MSETNTDENRDVVTVDSEPVEAEVESAEGKVESEKTFTQAEVDKIVANRVAREELKFNAFTEEAKSWKAAAAEAVVKLQALETSFESATETISKLELEKVKMVVAADSKLDPEVFDSLKWSNEEELRAAVDKLKSSFKAPSDTGFSGKSYSNDDSAVKYAQNVIKKYQGGTSH